MSEGMTQGAGEGTGTATEMLRLYRPNDAFQALGMAVNHLMGKPAFARLRFGAWSRILVGQINRGHFAFVLDRENRVQGFVGWTVVSKERADLWLEEDRDLGSEDSGLRTCLVINAWSANTDGVTRFMLAEARRRGRGITHVYFKRHYENGTVRRVRLRVDGRHTGVRGASISGPSDRLLHAPA